MRRLGYRFAVEWIALNDESGGPEALDVEFVQSYITTGLVADLFGVTQERVAKDVVRYRKKHAKAAS